MPESEILLTHSPTPHGQKDIQQKRAECVRTRHERGGRLSGESMTLLPTMIGRSNVLLVCKVLLFVLVVVQHVVVVGGELNDNVYFRAVLVREFVGLDRLRWFVGDFGDFILDSWWVSSRHILVR